MKRILHSAVGIIAVGAMLSSPLLMNAQDNAFEPITNTFGDIVPQQGIYTELSGFTIQFTSGFQSDYIEPMGYTKKVTLIDETSNALITDCTVKGGTGKVTVALDQTVTEPGHYILLVPEGALGWEDEWGNFEEIQEMRFRLWVEKNEFEPISGRYGSVNPEQGIYSSLKEITLTMEAYSSDYLEAGTKKITLLDETTNETVATFSVKPGTGKVILSLPEEFTVPGHYVMQIPEGALGYEDDWYGEWNDCPEMNFRYWIEGAEQPPVEAFTPISNRYASVVPEQGVYASLKEITMTLQGYASDYVEAGPGKSVTLIDEDTETILATLTVKGGYGKVTLTFPEEFTANGHYILDVPEGALGYDDDSYGWEDCPAMQFRYWIDQATGMEMLTPAESVIADVYSITGTCVLKNASQNDLRSLPSGLYIHNGKKIALK